MARVFLHIGPHKTGTSFVQSLFHLNRPRLAGAGIHYPDIGSNAHHGLAAVWITTANEPENFSGAGGPEGLWDDLIDRYAKAPGTLFLSSENFSRAHPEVVDMADLARRLSAFDEVKVIYTMRRQAEMVQSIWLQVAKSGHILTLRPYVRRAIEKRLTSGVRIDYGSTYEILLTGFDPEQIILLDYARISRADGGIGQVFLDLLGAESGLRAADLVQPPSLSANISPDPLAFQMATLINGNSVPDDDLVRVVAQVLRDDPTVPTTLLARYEHARFASRFRPGNAALVERVQPWQPGFTFGESEPPQNLIYRDDVTEQTWIDIAAALYRSRAKPFGLGRRQNRLS